jgi:H+/gluconate symporter-like permease
MSGMSEGESLRTFSIVLTIMGFVGLAATITGAILLPGR